MKKFIKVSSSVNITVNAGLKSINMSNADAHVMDRLNVKPAWVGTNIDIKQGVGYYPSEIKNWNSVKVLVDRGVITIGEETDTCPDQEKVEAIKAKLQREMLKSKAIEKQVIADIQSTEVTTQKLSF